MMHDNALNVEPRNEHNSHEIHELNKTQDVNRDHHAVVHKVLAVQGGVHVAARNRRDVHNDERYPGPAPDQDAPPHRAPHPGEGPEQSAPREKAPRTAKQK